MMKREENSSAGEFRAQLMKNKWFSVLHILNSNKCYIVMILACFPTETETIVGHNNHSMPCCLMRVGGSGSLTVGEVGRGEAVVHEDTVGFSHFQVDHVRSVFQGSDGVFVGHLLQASTVHLNTEERHEECINNNNMREMFTLRKSWGHEMIFKHEDVMKLLWSSVLKVLQPAACLRSAASRLCVQLLPRWSWWHRCCCLPGCAGSPLRLLYWSQDLQHTRARARTGTGTGTRGGVDC